MVTNLTNIDHFFSTARERYQIKLRRESGQAWPWTTDPIFKEWRFTNVHREDDRTTQWLRNQVRNPLSKIAESCQTHISKIEALEHIVRAVLIFRWFNRIETGEQILDLLLGEWNTAEARNRLTGISPVVTGAYIIKAGDGVSKLEGILACIDQALPRLNRFVTKWEQRTQDLEISLEEAWKDLKTLNYMGGFMAYEVVTDLRHTPVLSEANDIMLWGNLGPGAIRGIGWLIYDSPHAFSNSIKDQIEMLKFMRQLLDLTKVEAYWPQNWPVWEMHEVEMWLCEYAKYRNGMAGDRLKRRYRQ